MSFYSGPFSLSLPHLTLHLLPGLQASNTCLYVLSAPTLLFWGENRGFQKRTSVSSPPNLFPHLAGPLPSTIRSLCTEVQPVHLCLIPAVPLAESRTLSSCSHFWGSCYSVRVVSSRCAFQSAPMHFLNPSYIHHL